MSTHADPAGHRPPRAWPGAAAWPLPRRWRWVVLMALAGLGLAGGAWAQPGPDPLLKPCRLKGLSQDAWCGSLPRPLDPAVPSGPQIDVQFVVLPALARHKKPDPIVFLAGGPGQSAVSLAPMVARQFSRSLNRRDLVLVDQRGTGRSAPLDCGDESPGRPLADASIDTQLRELAQCRERLQRLPHGQLQHYSTTVAMADLDAVRAALQAPRINLVGASYGTRAALEYQRQFPERVRRTVLDGVAPPDMVLPQSFGQDTQTALKTLFAACDADAMCAARYGPLRPKWDGLLASLPRTVILTHPLTAVQETVTLTPDMLTSWVRLPLYVPSLTAALPQALHEASQGRFAPLLGLASSLGGGRSRATRLAMGQHFSVVCAEDVPRMAPGGSGFSDLYRRACADWPRATIPDAFYTVPPAKTPVLVFSGGADPATPPRHGERVTQALGAQARHRVVPGAGHGVMSLPCLRDAVHRFIDADDPAAALATDLSCAQQVPRATIFQPVQPATRAASAAGQGGGQERP
ncbi:MAG: alpha/beta hydrolase [Rubrivivax sp.]|nr:alpha/beta hydrolase [Rubrivivax sp.]